MPNQAITAKSLIGQSKMPAGRVLVGALMVAGLAMLGVDVPAIAETGPVLTPPASVSTTKLTAEDVDYIIGRVVQEATARHTPATVAIVDRLGAVLAVYQMTNAPKTFPIESNPKGPNAIQLVDGLSGLASASGHPLVPATMEVISKAITGAYLSSSKGNAFSTRTASQIVQDHFNPGTEGAPSGPLFGVQFSQLPCSDLMVRANQSATRGPQRAPLGLAGDPGGFPLYKHGELVGGIGVKAVGPYRVDEDIYDNDHSADEIIALAGTYGFGAPSGIIASTITAGGLTLRYSDAAPSDFLSNPAKAVPYPNFPASMGKLIPVPGYYAGTAVRAGNPYGSTLSGIVQDSSGTISSKVEPMLLVDQKSRVRYPASASPNAIPAGALTQAETLQLLRAAYASGLQTRAQIRNPPGSVLAVTISVVDATGAILGIATIPDAPVFGIDVSLQKARSSVFMSSAIGDQQLLADPTLAKFSKASTAFFGKPVFSGGYAWGARAIGNIERDSFPDGIDTTPNGPLSLVKALSTPFSDGLQLDLVLPNIVQHVLFVGGLSPTDTVQQCTALPPAGHPVLSNGLQIFPGGFPIYRNGKLVGGIGISGDGVDQDDMTAFLGLYNAGQQLKTGIEEAPFSIRASVLQGQGGSPHYVNCPYAPYVNSNSQNLCGGK